MVKNIVVGAGITGITIAERLASRGEEVLIVEKRDTIGGNCHDHFDNDGNYIQTYGPHIFHTKHEDVKEYLSRFTGFNDYKHHVYCYIEGNLINIPFNLNSLELAFNAEKANLMKNILLREIGEGQKVPILQLRNHENPAIRELSEYIYYNVFLNYTTKQWGKRPEEIDPSVTARVPVIVSRDDGYFQDDFQGIPEKGYTYMFNKMLDKTNIKVLLSTDYKDVISDYKYDMMYYTGPLDCFFDYKHGKIKYRRIRLQFEKKNIESFQPNTVVNYPNDEDFTRITEFNKFLGIKNKSTVIAKEYPSWEEGFPAYPPQEGENKKIIYKYKEEAQKINKTIFLGRMAECRYINMDQAVKKVLEYMRQN